MAISPCEQQQNRNSARIYAFVFWFNHGRGLKRQVRGSVINTFYSACSWRWVEPEFNGFNTLEKFQVRNKGLMTLRFCHWMGCFHWVERNQCFLALIDASMVNSIESNLWRVSRLSLFCVAESFIYSCGCALRKSLDQCVAQTQQSNYNCDFR